jgi:phage-related protein
MTAAGLPQPTRPLLWVGSSRKDYADFPAEVQEAFGFRLFLAQTGQHPPSAKVMKGFGGGVIELIEEFDGGAYRAVYTVRFEHTVYVLHCFQKKSKRGIKTPKSDIDLVKMRLRRAEADDKTRRNKEPTK